MTGRSPGQAEATPSRRAASATAAATEELTRADADVILYSSYGPADGSGEAAVVAGRC